MGKSDIQRFQRSSRFQKMCLTQLDPLCVRRKNAVCFLSVVYNLSS